MNKKLAYRPDIDGLRAIAVLAVIAGHLPEKFLSSGYLGVDVFFVISGFVVTASLLSQEHIKLFQVYPSFIAKRVKRLLPALVVCVGLTGIAVIAVDPYPLNSIQTGVASLFGISNFTLLSFELDYFSPSSRFNAFTHTWSLGVEEQFYLIYPLLGWLFYFRLNKQPSRAFPAALVAVSLLSVILFIGLYDSHSAATYYMMPTRIWELGAGALMFLASRRQWSSQCRTALHVVSPVALIILVSCFFAPSNWAVPATLVAATMTCLLLLNDGKSHAAILLTLPPTIFIGRISYSLYLWHWPVIVIGPMLLSQGLRSSLWYVIIIGICASLSYYIVEKPLRRRAWTSSRLRDIGSGFAISALLGAALLVSVVKTDPESLAVTDVPYPPSFLPLIPSGRPYGRLCVVDGKWGKLYSDTVDLCTVKPLSGSGMPTIWAMGDSHAGHLQGLLYELHHQLGVGVHLIETPGWSFPFSGEEEFAMRTKIFERSAKKMKPGDIVLLARLYLSRSNPPVPKNLEPWLPRVSDLADTLAQRGVSLVVAGPPPMFQFEDIRSCDLEEPELCRQERSTLDRPIGEIITQLSNLARGHDNIVVFDIFDAVCAPDLRFCYPNDKTSFLFRDKDHFNSLGSARLAQPFVELLRSTGTLVPP